MHDSNVSVIIADAPQVIKDAQYVLEADTCTLSLGVYSLIA